MKGTPIRYWLGIAALAYCAVSGTVYAFRHPWKTSTERLLETHRALTWAVEERPSFR